MATFAGFWLTLSSAAISLSCARHVRLEIPETTPAASYTCKAGSEHTCTPADSLVPADENRSGTAFVILPKQCGGRIHRILIVDADSSEPKVNVTCAPNEGPPEPIEEAGQEVSKKE